MVNLAIVGASGKIGGATLRSLLSEHLIPASEIICTTSAQPSDPKWESLSKQGVQVRHATFDDPSSFEKALADCVKLYLVSSPRIAMDFDNAPHGQGREKDHFVAIDAAKKAGVKHIYYTSLAFQNPSKSGVMTAHERTEEYLAKVCQQSDMRYTIIREGLYNESWPLYFGHYDVKSDERDEVPVGGDSPISWTGIADLGLANALVIASPKTDYAGKTFYLSNTKDPKSLKDIAKMVSEARGKETKLKVVSREEHEDYYVNERKMPEPMIKWWAKTYDALRDGECMIKDTTFEELLSSRGRTPKPVEQTVKEMIGGA